MPSEGTSIRTKDPGQHRFDGVGELAFENFLAPLCFDNIAVETPPWTTVRSMKFQPFGRYPRNESKQTTIIRGKNNFELILWILHLDLPEYFILNLEKSSIMLPAPFAASNKKMEGKLQGDDFLRLFLLFLCLYHHYYFLFLLHR